MTLFKCRIFVISVLLSIGRILHPAIAGLALVFLLAACGRVAAYSGGTGEPNDPYLIATAEDMNGIGANPDDWDAHFLLTNDINLTDYTGTQFNIIGYFEKWDSPNNAPFTGSFDGNKHTISNFTYTTTNTNYIGIFGYIDGPNAEVKDLNLVDPNVNAAANSDYVGSLVGHLENGTIIGCNVNRGNTVGKNHVGGLVGENYRGTISNCNANGAVSGNWIFGGLVGYNNSKILDCTASGNVSGYQNMGGLVGCNYGRISNCYAIGSVSGDKYTGGLAGKNYATVSNCYATGDVSGGDYTGGLVAENYGGTVSNCYATGSVLGATYTGGLVGWNYKSKILYCYAIGSVSGGSYTGGLVGYNPLSTVTASFWDIETSGQSSSAGGEGKTTAEMQTESTFTDAGWDFVGETTNGTEDIWTIYEDISYPELTWQTGAEDEDEDEVQTIDMTITKCIVKAGKTQGQDSFDISGTFEELLDLNDITQIDVNIVSLDDSYLVYEESIDFDASEVVKGKFKYKGQLGAITSLKIDFNRRTVAIKLKNVNLTGLGCPLQLNITLGNYIFSGEADEDVVNGANKNIPIRLMRTYKDEMRVKSAKAKNSTKALADTFTVKGEIAVEDVSVDLASEDVVITWGEQTFTIPAGNFTAQSGNSYKCSKILTTGDSGLVTAKIDLDKCTFNISVKNAELDDVSNPVEFGLSFAEFDETADINPW